MPIGPQLPSSAEKRKRVHDEDDSNSDSDDEVGPQLPTSKTEDPQPKKPRTIGPSLPPALTPKKSPERNVNSDSEDEDEDDDFGPALPSSNTTKENSASDLKSTMPTNPTSKAPTAQPQVARDEWMTLAPKSGDWSQRVDPTKLKNRKFNTGGRSGHPASASSGGSASWHETPEQKQARLQRQVLGTKDRVGSDRAASKPADGMSSAEDLETARRMKEYNKQRGPSLYEAHQKKHEDEAADDDPSARAFDREKDMGAGLQLNSTQRREMLKKSANFSSRFSSARYL